MLLAAVTNAEFVGYACLTIGAIVLGAGVFVGVRTSMKSAKADAKAKLESARASLNAAVGHIAVAQAAAPDTAAAATAGSAATSAATEAKSAIEQAASIISALPEDLRFSGLLILIGSILIGVATVQFGGVSLF